MREREKILEMDFFGLDMASKITERPSKNQLPLGGVDVSRAGLKDFPASEAASYGYRHFASILSKQEPRLGR